MLSWLRENWMWLLIVGVPWVAVAILNKATVVWHEQTGKMRWFQFFISILSPLPSLGRGWLKMPGLPELPWGKVKQPGDPDPGQKGEDLPPDQKGTLMFELGALFLGLSLVLLAVALLSGCASSAVGKLGQLQTSVGGLRQSATIVLDSRCADVIPECPAGGLSKCPPYQQCSSVRKIIYASAVSLQVTIDTAASLADLGKTAEAEAMLGTIAAGLERLVQQLTYYGIIGNTKSIQPPVAAPASQPAEVK